MNGPFEAAYMVAVSGVIWLEDHRLGPRRCLDDIASAIWSSANSPLTSYSLRMHRTLRTRTHAIVWLLCAIFVCLTVDSPHCDVCDGLSFVNVSSQPRVHHHVPTAPDPCNGHCSCCVLQGLPIAAPALGTSNIALASDSPDSQGTPRSQPSSLFRPPRMTIS